MRHAAGWGWGSSRRDRLRFPRAAIRWRGILLLRWAATSRRARLPWRHFFLISCLLAAVQIPGLEQDSCFFFEKREAWSQYPDTVTRQSRTSVRTPAVRNPQFSLVGPCDRSVGMGGHSSYRLCDRVSRVNIYATHAATGATALCPVCVQARRFEPAVWNWVSPNIASRRNAARP